MSDSHSSPQSQPNPQPQQSPQSQQPVSPVAGLQIPVAVVESTVSERKDRRGGISRLWWLTLGCVILAGWLAWTSLPSKGITIVIQFPEGHGLKAGDPIRHRGIDVGQVTDVRLTQDMTSIIATATLLPGSEQLANAGTRFWIVRRSSVWRASPDWTQPLAANTSQSAQVIPVRPLIERLKDLQFRRWMNLTVMELIWSFRATLDMEFQQERPSRGGVLMWGVCCQSPSLRTRVT